jgi:hypothetical protein
VDEDQLESLLRMSKETCQKYNLQVQERPQHLPPPDFRTPEERVEAALGGLCPKMPGAQGAKSDCKDPKPRLTASSNLSWCEYGQECEYHKTSAKLGTGKPPTVSPAAAQDPNARRLEQVDRNGGSSCHCSRKECSERDGIVVKPERNQNVSTNGAGTGPKKAQPQTQRSSSLAKEVAAIKHEYGVGGPNCRLRTSEKPPYQQVFRGPHDD